MKKWNVRGRLRNMVETTAERLVRGFTLSDEAGENFTDTESVTLSSPDVLVKAGLDEVGAMDSSLYAAAHEGAHVKLSDMEALKEYMRKVKENKWEPHKASSLMQIAEDYRIDSLTAKDRPGYLDLRRRSMKPFIAMFGNRPSPDMDHNTTKAISALTYGQDMRDFPEWEKLPLDWETIEDAANEIMQQVKDSIESGESTSFDSARIAEEQYLKRWHREGESGDSDDPDDKEDDGEGAEGEGEGEWAEAEKATGDVKGSTSKGSDSDGEGGEVDVEDADEEGGGKDGEGKDGGGKDKEYGSESDTGGGKRGVDESDIEKSVKELMKSPLEALADEDGKEELGKAKESVEKDAVYAGDLEERKEEERKTVLRSMKYGPSLWTPEEHKRYERALCRDIHAGTVLHYAQAKTMSDSARAHYTSRLDNSDRAQAKLLESRIRDMLRAARQDDGYYSDNGTVDATKAWKLGTTGDNRVFFKPEYSEEGGYVVDLLLDASGSQGSREISIAVQSWILTEAISRAGIPIRVISFDNVHHLTYLERIRDYEDDPSRNEYCLAFRARSENRDGLAIAAVAKGLEERPETKKIMIVLSDGHPADGHSSSIIERSGGLYPYIGKTPGRYSGGITSGVDDVSQVVRSIRRKGIALMGIYVGENPRTLEFEKLMYGNDFAYIRNMNSFVPTVTRYLEKQIKGMDMG